MSLDNLSECKSCGAHAAASLWMQFFGSIQQAQMHGEGPEFISAFMPGPTVLKVNACISCKEIKLSTDYMPEEIEALKEHAEKQKKRNQLAGDMGKLFGGLLGGQKPSENKGP
jgi:hypothetical protein